MAHPNVELLRRMDEAMMRGDMATMFGAYADDVVVHMGGDNKVSGTFKGVDELRGLFGRFMEAAGEYSFENHAYLADDAHGVILQRGTMKRGDRSFSTDEAFIYHIRDGKLSEFWYVPVDQAGVDAWFGK